MTKLKIVNLLILVFSVITAQSHITIYNQNKAFVQEQRILELNKKGPNTVQLDHIPKNADPSSVLIQSESFHLQSIKYAYNPISITSLLHAHVGTLIELVKYGDDGSIIFSTIGKLISNNAHPVFEIDDKIVVDPPYHYVFSDIPEGISEFPFIQCNLNATTKRPKYHISYFSTGFDWEAEYTLILSSESEGEINGYYAIHNDTQLEYNNTKLSLVSGFVQFQGWSQPDRQHQKRMASMTYAMENESSPLISESGEYVVFHVPEKITLSSNSEVRYNFLNNKRVSVDKIYHISHSLSRVRRSYPPQTTGIPVHIRYEIKAEDVGDFQLPAGSYKVYNRNENILTFMGSGTAAIVEKDTKIKLETGKAHKILSLITVENFKLNKDSGKAVLTAQFENRKDSDVRVEWVEQINDSKWEINSASIKYERIDAFNIKFVVDIKANSSTEIFFTAILDAD